MSKKTKNKTISLYNGSATSELMSITAAPDVDTITDIGTIKQGELKVFMKKYSELKGIRTSTLKLLDICTALFTRLDIRRGKAENDSEVIISLDAYMELCGIANTKPSKDKFRAKIKEDMDTLYNISLEWREDGGGFSKTRICDKIKLVGGNITMSFSHDMAKYLRSLGVSKYPLELLRVDERNKNLYPLGRKLILNAENILSVRSLLAVCPDIPTADEVRKGNRCLTDRIRQPFERALSSLPFAGWEYCTAGGAPISSDTVKNMSFTEFTTLYIRFNSD